MKFAIKLAEASLGVRSFSKLHVALISAGALELLSIGTVVELFTVVELLDNPGRVTVMDMQGRVVSNFSMKNAEQVPLNLRQGNYMLRVKQGASNWVRTIRIAE